MKKETDHTYTLTLTVNNQPSVLTRCSQIFGRRNHNIETIRVLPKDSEHSLMTITAFGHKNRMEQIIAQLAKLHDVQSISLQED